MVYVSLYLRPTKNVSRLWEMLRWRLPQLPQWWCMWALDQGKLSEKEGATRERKFHPCCKDPSLSKFFVPLVIFSWKVLSYELCLACESKGLAKRYFKQKSHKCKAWAPQKVKWFWNLIMEYLDLVPVVENPNVVKAMQKKLTDLGKPFVVFIFNTLVVHNLIYMWEML